MILSEWTLELIQCECLKFFQVSFEATQEVYRDQIFVLVFLIYHDRSKVVPEKLYWYSKLGDDANLKASVQILYITILK